MSSAAPQKRSRSPGKSSTLETAPEIKVKKEDSPYGDVVETPSLNAFKKSFKYYKQKKPPPSFADVIDIANLPSTSTDVVTPISLKQNDNPALLKRHGLRPISEWHAIELAAHKGLFIVKNVLSRQGEYLWAQRSLQYARQPNITNIDAFIDPREAAKFDVLTNARSLDKLRWTTLGYHHNWETKCYSEDFKSPMPPALGELCAHIASALGYADFVAEAGIIHYYHHNSTLSGHVDASERNLDAPLIAVSIGQSGLFLMGGPTLDTVPTPVWLRSGDVMIMTGPARLGYHGIPRIVRDRTFKTEPGEDGRVVRFLNENRINMNIRQVNFAPEQYAQENV